MADDHQARAGQRAVAYVGTLADMLELRGTFERVETDDDDDGHVVLYLSGATIATVGSAHLGISEQLAN